MRMFWAATIARLGWNWLNLPLRQTAARAFILLGG